MLKQERFVAESPQHTDTRQMAGRCRQDVHIAVANVDCRLATFAQLAKGYLNSIGCRLAPDAWGLTHSHVYQIAEKMPAQRLRGLHKLVADYGNLAATLLQPLKHLDDAFVRLSQVSLVLQVILPKRLKHLVHPTLAYLLGQSSLHQFPNTVAYESAHFIKASLFVPMLTQSMIAGTGQIAKRIEQRTVEVEDIGIEFHILHHSGCKITKNRVQNKKNVFLFFAEME